MIDLVWLGQVCGMCRRAAGYTQQKVADDLNYAGLSSVSKFEHGETNSIDLLAWYLEHTDLSPWMFLPSHKAMQNVDSIAAFLDDLNNYRRDFAFTRGGKGL